MKKAVTAAVLCCIAAEAGAEISVSGYGSFDISSAYVLYGARQNKEPCAWTYAELSATDDKWGGLFASLWQNTDLTCRRSAVMRRVNEWDWAAGGRAQYVFSEDWILAAEVGHIWYKYHGLHGMEAKATYKTMMEAYGRCELRNPYLTPYFFAAFDWKVTEGMFMTTGVKRDFSLPYGLTLTPDINIGGGDDRYLACLYPPWNADRVNSCLSYTQLAMKLAYRICDWAGVHATVAYSIIVNDRIRSAIGEDNSDAAKQFVWGTVGINFSF
jgi:hypothetical protein